MKITTYPLRRNAAIIAAAAVVGGLGIGGVVTANADSSGSADNQGQVQRSDGDGEQDDATEVESDGETDDHASDVGPDADPQEPGHQDASDNG
ncbi:MAG: hypothetical protein OSB43_06120 [Nocardioides sp.]|uniref:hypothetical protein n=1 Tax=Nocardioides sp. TaxID=35761 RepID=UPI002385C09C|nr:hypothetical protein [Nocardioides sp.]MDE0775826.1 hypothetical protein [Nocardioides sp.]